ncbi:NTP pyrophosphohydrolase [Brachybacterium endophyticum]|uniref:NTP pyrophosphohydrolase n=1 Tax=Brachybacterium endophyticum TaxID=2182385 RepID=A0A2U2RJD7_9MICO|nr:NUDIX hydrolase [Brachybacterium endophyticum]PWH05905.1 NTP pyrophosphohydrolase [Brachybacterium endophyticum]
MSEALRDVAGARPVTSRSVVHRGAIWDVVRDEVDFAPGVAFAREYIAHPGAAAILAVDGPLDGDPSQVRVLLIRQYRHPAARTFWELPAGLLDHEGEDPLEAAGRELAEETGYAAGSMRHLLDIHPSAGSSSELIRIHLATDLTRAEVDFEREDEESEIEVRWARLPDVLGAIRAGELTNATLVAAVLALRALGT